MAKQRLQTAGLALAAVSAILSATPVSAQSVADFYKGREVDIIIGSGVGGGYDQYSRVLAPYWSRHMPGNPNMVVKNMPGAEGAVMMNYLAVKAKTDGTEIGNPFGQSLIQPVFDKGAVSKYDSRKMNWIGNISAQSVGCFTWKAHSAVKTMQDAMEKSAIMASTGAISATSIYANVLNRLTGTKFKVVNGYSTSEATLAMERGEAEGTCLSFATLVTEHPDWVEQNKLNWLSVFADKPDPNLPGVPIVADFVKNPDDKQVVSLLISQLEMGRPYVAPPGVPADRLAALRTSFMEAMKDPAYLAEAQRLHQIVAPSDHNDMEQLIDTAYTIPDRIIQKASDLINSASEDPNAPKKKKGE
ncbi:MAG TPA: tripartite tricarboxylate transporter substrate-binding protein [Beijerinckiaceae bacterium]|nr:tripartite tricarboxylate transporter substrate-binding protein [Beijerinckiaceae bacterium]